MNEKKPGNPWAKSLMIWRAVLFGLVLLSQMFGTSRAAPAGAIPYSQFVRDVNEGSVQAVTIAPSQTGNMAISPSAMAASISGQLARSAIRAPN